LEPTSATLRWGFLFTDGSSALFATPLRPIGLLVVLAAGVTAAHEARAEPAFVSNVTAVAQPTHYNGPCPGAVTLTGTIYASGPVTVSYRWERGDGSVGPVRTTHVGDAPRAVTTTVTLGTPAKVVHASARLRVLSPGDVYSSEASFTVACGGAKEPSPSDD
jgi:hypothetical protein